jgi:hypothetical protein
MALTEPLLILSQTNKLNICRARRRIGFCVKCGRAAIRNAPVHLRACRRGRPWPTRGWWRELIADVTCRKSGRRSTSALLRNVGMDEIVVPAAAGQSVRVFGASTPPGQMQSKPGGANELAPGEIETEPGGAKDLAPGRVGQRASEVAERNTGASWRRGAPARNRFPPCDTNAETAVMVAGYSHPDCCGATSRGDTSWRPRRLSSAPPHPARPSSKRSSCSP